MNNVKSIFRRRPRSESVKSKSDISNDMTTGGAHMASTDNVLDRAGTGANFGRMPPPGPGGSSGFQPVAA